METTSDAAIRIFEERMTHSIKHLHEQSVQAKAEIRAHFDSLNRIEFSVDNALLETEEKTEYYRQKIGHLYAGCNAFMGEVLSRTRSHTRSSPRSCSLARARARPPTHAQLQAQHHDLEGVLAYPGGPPDAAQPQEHVDISGDSQEWQGGGGGEELA